MKTLKKISTPFLLFASVFLWSSCEGATNREWKVTNNSSSTVYVEMKTFGSDLKTESIKAGETKTTSIFNTKKGAKAEMTATEDITSFLIYNDTDTSKKDHNNNENWVSDSEKNKGIPAEYTHKFTFTVADSDF